ncbi:MAG TPA: acetyltransferase [Thermoanaerobaculia bacterium]|nr:acetyltransferase [Thermoanaerobaculia bacterium]
MTSGVAVLGAGGHAKVVIATLQAAGLTPTLVLDDDRRTWGRTLLGVAVRGPIESLRDSGCSRAVAALGDNRERERVVAQVESRGAVNWVTVVHPAAWVHESVQLGAGTVVFAGAVLQPDAVVGRHAILNTAATVDHDCRLGDCVHLAPGAHLAGNVTVGDGGFVGIGSAVLPGIEIGAWACVGAGAVVVSKVAPATVVAGVPARAREPQKSQAP